VPDCVIAALLSSKDTRVPDFDLPDLPRRLSRVLLGHICLVAPRNNAKEWVYSALLRIYINVVRVRDILGEWYMLKCLGLICTYP
jgi:hypothetical protein